MAASAEAVQESSQISEVAEEYGRSLAAMRHAGHLIVDAHVSVETVREDTELYHEFKTAVKEMVKNDPEHHDSLELSNRREHQIIDGQTVNAKGEPMVDVLRNGVLASRLLAETDVDYGHQVMRDTCDVRLAERVDDMPVGTTIWGISKEPTKALKKRPDIYHKRFGYVEGLIYIQTYSKVDDNTLETGSYSIEYKDVNILRDFLAARDMVIPEDESDDTWLDYAQLSDMSADEAHRFAVELRREHGIAENSSQTYSADAFIDEHESVVQAIFDRYYPAMAEATVTNSNNETLMNLAAALLDGRAASLKPEIRQQLLVLHNSNRFNDESAKVLDSILRYATVEELRKYLPTAPRIPQVISSAHPMTTNFSSGYEADISIRLAQNVYTGVEAGRSYPGCPGNIQLGNDNNESSEAGPDGINRQEAYGGQGKDCPEIKDGQMTTCPHCKKRVAAIVPNRETIYCSNAECKLAAPGLVDKAQTKTAKIGKGIMDLWQKIKKPPQTTTLTQNS